MARISVILTSFNHGKYIRETIDSILNQTLADFELIILDDCSADNSWGLINQYSDPRIKAFRSVKQGEVAYRMNHAISELALGEYIAIHHSDDVWELDKLEKQAAFLNANPEIGAVFTNALAIGEDSLPIADESHKYSSVFDQPNRTRHEWLRFFFNHGNALCHPSVLIRKSCYEDCGLYRYGMAQLPDFDMWIRLCLKYEIHVLPEKLIKFRVRDNEANASGGRSDTRIRTQYEFYKLLPNYRSLARFDELVKVFPSAEKYNRNEETDIDFVLGMTVLEQQPFPFALLFGQDILFEVLSDPMRAANIKRLYDFSHSDFMVLTGQHDIFSVEALGRRDEVIAVRDKAITERDEQISEIYASTSWRLTRPLRFIVRLLREPKPLFSRFEEKPHVASLMDDYSADVPFAYTPMVLESPPSLAVICHMFYVDMLDEIAIYLCKIPFVFDLYITTDTQEKKAKIEDFFFQWNRGKVEVRIAPNRGRDIAPKLVTCRDVYANYEYILHIHTKKSPHHGPLSEWRPYLMGTLLGSTEVVNSVFEAFGNIPDLGMIAPQHFDGVRNAVGWGLNFKIAKKLARRMGVKVHRDDPIDFPSGSMFWARSAAIKPLLDCNLSFDEFPLENNQVDQTLAHAIERLYFVACELAGYSWIKISCRQLAPNLGSEKRISNRNDLVSYMKNFRHELIKNPRK